MNLRAMLFMATVLVCSTVSAEQKPVESVYKQHCAACHLPDGAGVPGAYPRLAGRVGPIADTQAGREYLVQVVTKGLMGPLTVDGATIQGVMPPQGLSDAETAAVLNELLNMSSEDAYAHTFSPGEVKEIRAKHKDVKMPNVLQLRPASAAAASAGH